MEEFKYYRLDRILELNCDYNIIFGERSNGKTYACLEKILIDWVKYGIQGAIIRRWAEDFRGNGGKTMFENLINNGVVEKLTNGKYNNIYYYSQRWYLCKIEEMNDKQKVIKEVTPFCFAFSLGSTTHYKSTSYPNVKNIVFDEFLINGGESDADWENFMSIISTIVRTDKIDAKIFLCANTVNFDSIFFRNFGIDALTMKPGEIRCYSYERSGKKCHLACEYVESSSKAGGKPTDKYFAFDTPELRMVTEGEWSVYDSPKLPIKYRPKDVIFRYWIKYNERLLECEIINIDDVCFTYIHRKTTPLKDEPDDLIYSSEWSPKPNWKRKITKPMSNIETKVYEFFLKDKVFYQDNMIAQMVKNYIEWSKTDD